MFPVVDATLSTQQMRLGIEIKHSSEDKDKHIKIAKGLHADEVGGSASSTTTSTTEKFTWSGRVRGQSTVELMALYKMCDWPLELVVTNGRYCHILKLGDDALHVWEGLYPTLAFDYIARYLSQV